MFFLKKILQFRILRVILKILIITTILTFLNLEINQIQSYAYTIYGKIFMLFNSVNNNDNKCNVGNEYDYLMQENTLLKEEITLLRNNLKLIDNHDNEYITTKISQLTFIKDEQAFIIAAGSENNVQIGNLVINEFGILGKVSNVMQKFSTVSLIGNDNVKIIATILPSTQDCIIGKRTQDASLLEVYYINDNDNIQDGDKVVTSGKDGMTPFGIHIGNIYKKNNKLFLKKTNYSLSSIIVKVIISNHLSS